MTLHTTVGLLLLGSTVSAGALWGFISFYRGRPEWPCWAAVLGLVVSVVALAISLPLFLFP